MNPKNLKNEISEPNFIPEKILSDTPSLIGEEKEVTKKQVPQPIEDTRDLLTFLQENKDIDISLPRNTSLKLSQVDLVLRNFAGKNKLSVNQSKVIIALLFQSGGTNRSCDGNLEISAFDKTFKLASLRKSLSDCKFKGCERKLARALSSEIAFIAKTYEVPGNLTTRIQRMHPEASISLDISVWLSDFQSSNPDCPVVAKNYINESFDRRSPQSKKFQKK